MLVDADVVMVNVHHAQRFVEKSSVAGIINASLLVTKVHVLLVQ